MLRRLSGERRYSKNMKALPAFAKRKILAHSQAQMFQVLDVEGEGLFVSVVCGGVAMYMRIIKLADDEIELFWTNGEESLYALVYEICKGQHSDREFSDARDEIYKRG